MKFNQNLGTAPYRMIIDTETIGLNKPFVYDIGGVIVDKEGCEIDRFSYCIEQIWHNKLLFSTAYYAEKRPIYVRALRGKTMKLVKFGIAMRNIEKLMITYDITKVYAFNSDFDKGAIDFTCKNLYATPCFNPFVEWRDIRKIVAPIFTSPAYTKFCIENNLLTDTGRVGSSVETIKSFKLQEKYTENHTALEDSRDESDILFTYGIDYYKGENEPESVFLLPTKPRELIIRQNGKDTKFTYMSKTERKGITYLK